MNRHPFLTLLIASSLAACSLNTAPNQPTIPTPNQANTAPLPYPQPNWQSQFNALAQHVGQLEQQLQQLQTRVNQLEQRRASRPRPSPTPPSISGSLNANNSTTSPLNQAQQAYAQGQHQQVLQLLRGADSGGNGSDTARQSMYLLLQSHRQIGNCQSVINIGQRYAILYAHQAQADEALYAVGQCQWQIQQRDVARDTWQKLIRLYPNSTAAKRAATQL